MDSEPGNLLKEEEEKMQHRMYTKAMFSTVLVVVALYDRRTRLPMVMLIFMPLVLAALISVFKPIWLTRAFMPVVPFICLIVAMGAASGDRRSGGAAAPRWAFVGLAVAWAAIGMSQQFTREKGDGFKPAAELVRTLARPGDIVLADGDFLYWCFNWYYLGPDWGEPRHAYVLNPDWARMMKRLPPATTTLLGLSESDSSLSSGGATVMMWDRNKNPPEGSADLIVVRQQSSAQPAFPDRHLASSAHLQQILVERWVR
jgi:hypothetical protein